MKVCPQCRSEYAADDVTHCPACGCALESSPESTPPENDDLEFQVYENNSDNVEFVGGTDKFDPREEEDDLGIQSPGEALTEELQQADDTPTRPEPGPIGQSDPFLPPDQEPVGPEPEPADFSDLKAEAAEPPAEENDPNAVKKLSDDDIKAIHSNLYGNGQPFLDDNTKRDLLDKLEGPDQPFGNTPIVPPKKAGMEAEPEQQSKPEMDLAEISQAIESDLPTPSMADRGRGIAYYYKNIIQLRGRQNLDAEDEIVVGNRRYELRRKKMDRKPMLIGGGILFAALLFVIGSMFITNHSGDGFVVGVVVDENKQPYGDGIRVRFPELGKQFETNAQGMFASGSIPSGTHRVELVSNNEVLGRDYTTVVGNKVSTIMLQPGDSDEYAAEEDQRRAEAAREQAVSESQSAQAKQPRRETPPPPEPEQTASRSSQVGRRTVGADARLILAANVANARISLDGTVLGAGNLAYNQIKPGTYRYEVAKDGYEPASGKITLEAGASRTLEVRLSPLAAQVKQQEYGFDDFYFSGLSALQERDFPAAARDLTEAVRLDPGSADAHFSLGQAWAGVKDWPKAHDAFLRAAEIYQVGGDYQRAITAYSQAIQSDDKSVAAYLGRGNVFLRTGEARAALIDFETAVRIDNRSAPAYVGLGRARLNQGSYDKAVKHFEDARSIDSDNPYIHQYLTLAYLGENDFDKVEESWQRFTETASEQQVARVRGDSRYAAVVRVVDRNR